MGASYNNNSPWATTKIVNDYLDILTIRPVIAEKDDPYYEIETQYAHRPDLLAFELYGTSKLWWVFIQRNLDVLQDPIYDFIPGVRIYIPKPDNLLAQMRI